MRMLGWPMGLLALGCGGEATPARVEPEPGAVPAAASAPVAEADTAADPEATAATAADPEATAATAADPASAAIHGSRSGSRSSSTR